MNIAITPSRVEGKVTAPPSKSISHRALIIASLAEGKSILHNVLESEDTLLTLEALKACGVKIKHKRETLQIEGGLKNLHAPITPLDLHNSGSSLRMLTSFAALLRGETILTGSERLKERPMRDLLTALSRLGVQIGSTNGNAPLTITGGDIKGGKITLNGGQSSQFVSSLLMVAPFAQKNITLECKNLISKPYVLITIAVMRAFGANVEYTEDLSEITVQARNYYKKSEYTVEGDYTSGSYFFAGAAITGGEVTVKNLFKNSAQGDRYFVDILEKMGCTVRHDTTSITVTGHALKSIHVDMGDYPDIVQTLACVAAFAKGETVIENIGHLKHKETDRIMNTAKELRKTGVAVDDTITSLVIRGGSPKGTSIATHNDHRMAMAFTCLGVGAKGRTIIENANVVEKSFPTFFADMKIVGVRVEESN